MTQEERTAHWRGVVAELKGSGLSVAAFCRAHSLKTVQVRRWRRHFAEDAAAGAPVPLGCGSGFVELVRADTGTERAASGISVQVGNRLSIRLTRGFDVVTLKAVLLAVQEVAGC